MIPADASPSFSTYRKPCTLKILVLMACVFVHVYAQHLQTSTCRELRVRTVYLHAGDLCIPAVPRVRGLYTWDRCTCETVEFTRLGGDLPSFPHGKAARCARARSCSSSVRARLRLATRSDLAFVMLSAH